MFPRRPDGCVCFCSLRLAKPRDCLLPRKRRNESYWLELTVQHRSAAQIVTAGVRGKEESRLASNDFVTFPFGHLTLPLSLSNRQPTYSINQGKAHPTCISASPPLLIAVFFLLFLLLLLLPLITLLHVHYLQIDSTFCAFNSPNSSWQPS